MRMMCAALVRMLCMIVIHGVSPAIILRMSWLR
jgi:hypothetical protein